METYLAIRYTAQKAHAAALKQLFQTCASGSLEDVQDAGQALGKAGAEHWRALVDSDYGGESLMGVEGDPAKFDREVHFVAGFTGLELLVELLYMLAPFTAKLSATYNHDEEPEPPVKLSLRNGQVQDAEGRLYRQTVGLQPKRRSSPAKRKETAGPKVKATKRTSKTAPRKKTTKATRKVVPKAKAAKQPKAKAAKSRSTAVSKRARAPKSSARKSSKRK